MLHSTPPYRCADTTQHDDFAGKNDARFFAQIRVRYPGYECYCHRPLEASGFAVGALRRKEDATTSILWWEHPVFLHFDA
jgi:hypothetical protein